MATITPVRGEQQAVVIDLIHVPANIRELDPSTYVPWHRVDADLS